MRHYYLANINGTVRFFGSADILAKELENKGNVKISITSIESDMLFIQLDNMYEDSYGFISQFDMAIDKGNIHEALFWIWNLYDSEDIKIDTIFDIMELLAVDAESYNEEKAEIIRTTASKFDENYLDFTVNDFKTELIKYYNWGKEDFQ